MSGYLAQFQLRRASADKTGYYHTRWDKAVPVVVIASNEKEAINKADTFSGAPESGRYWTFTVDRIEEIPAPAEIEDKQWMKA